MELHEPMTALGACRDPGHLSPETRKGGMEGGGVCDSTRPCVCPCPHPCSICPCPHPYLWCGPLGGWERPWLDFVGEGPLPWGICAVHGTSTVGPGRSSRILTCGMA
jgi:hypothetical protein